MWLPAYRAVHRFVPGGETLPFARFPATAVQPIEKLSTCIDAIATQSDSAKPAMLGKRHINPQIKRDLCSFFETTKHALVIIDETRQVLVADFIQKLRFCWSS